MSLGWGWKLICRNLSFSTPSLTQDEPAACRRASLGLNGCKLEEALKFWSGSLLSPRPNAVGLQTNDEDTCYFCLRLICAVFHSNPGPIEKQLIDGTILFSMLWKFISMVKDERKFPYKPRNFFWLTGEQALCFFLIYNGKLLLATYVSLTWVDGFGRLRIKDLISKLSSFLTFAFFPSVLILTKTLKPRMALNFLASSIVSAWKCFAVLHGFC